MSKILVVGSLNMDLVMESPSVPVMGQTILGTGFMTSPGGKGANQAVAAARLGGDVAMVGCVGMDIFGKELINNLEINRVKNGSVFQNPGLPTGIAIIIVNEADNCIIVNPAANFSLTPEKINTIEPLIADSRIIMLQFEIPLESVRRVMEIAKKYGARILLNPAPAQTIDPDMWSMMDILIPNELECEQICGLPVKNVQQAKEAAGFLITKGCKQVFITLGAKGVVYNRDHDIFHFPAFEVQAVDTTAAGDSFSAAVAVGWAEGMESGQLVQFASAVGAMTVTHQGAQISLPNRQQVSDFLKAHRSLQ